MRLAPVSAENVRNIWPHVEKFISSACIRGPGNLTPDGLRVSCETKRHQLWIGIGDDGAEAAAVTGIYDDGDVRRAEWVAFGGSWAKSQEFMPVLEQWAKAQGCTAFRSYGRPGMTKRMPREYRVKGIIFEKEL